MKRTLLWQQLLKMPLSAARQLLDKAWLYKELFLCADTPWRVKAAMVAAMLYLLMPIDLIPDTIPFLGVSDDLALLGLVLSYADGFITPQLRERLKQRRA